MCLAVFEKKEERMGKRTFVKEYLEPIVIAILIALFIRAFIVQAFKIPSSSMEPTLLVGDHILVNKFMYGIRIPFTDTKLMQFKKPKRGDIIVFIYPKDRSKDFIKRVIGTEGEKVEMIRNKIYIAFAIQSRDTIFKIEMSLGVKPDFFHLAQIILIE